MVESNNNNNNKRNYESSDDDSDSDSAVAVRKVRKISELEWRIEQHRREREEDASNKGLNAIDMPGPSSTKSNEAPPTQHNNNKILSNEK